MPLFEGNELLGLIDRMRSAFVGRDEIVQRGADVVNSTSLAYGPTTQFVLQFDTVNKDTDGLFNLLSFPDRFIIKVAGWYVVSINLRTGSVPATGYEIVASVRKNGTTSVVTQNTVTANGVPNYMNASRVLYLGTGDYLQFVFQHNYTPGTVTVSATAYSPVFSIVRFP